MDLSPLQVLRPPLIWEGFPQGFGVCQWEFVNFQPEHWCGQVPMLDEKTCFIKGIPIYPKGSVGLRPLKFLHNKFVQKSLDLVFHTWNERCWGFVHLILVRKSTVYAKCKTFVRSGRTSARGYCYSPIPLRHLQLVLSFCSAPLSHSFSPLFWTALGDHFSLVCCHLVVVLGH